MFIWPTKISLYEYNFYAMYIVLFNAPFSSVFRIPVWLAPVGIGQNPKKLIPREFPPSPPKQENR